MNKRILNPLIFIIQIQNDSLDPNRERSKIGLELQSDFPQTQTIQESDLVQLHSDKITCSNKINDFKVSHSEIT